MHVIRGEVKCGTELVSYRCQICTTLTPAWTAWTLHTDLRVLVDWYRDIYRL